MDDCVFCNIVNKSMKADILFEDDKLVIVRDILPKAPVHFLVLPKRHIGSVNDLTEIDRELVGDMILAAKKMAEQQGIADTGYKLAFNVGHDGGQVVPHLHLHVLGGKKLAE